MNNNMVNNSKHVRFYEGMNYLETPTPNSIQLIISLGRTIPEDQEEAPITIPPALESQHIPFPMIHYVPFRVIYDHDTLGMILGYYPDRYSFYLK